MALSRKKEKKAFGFVTASGLMHWGAVALLMIAPALGLIPEGSEPLNETIEVTMLESSKGNQIKVKEAPAADSVKKNQATIEAPKPQAPVKKPVEAVKPVKVKKPVVKAEPKKKPAPKKALVPPVKKKPAPKAKTSPKPKAKPVEPDAAIVATGPTLDEPEAVQINEKLLKELEKNSEAESEIEKYTYDSKSEKEQVDEDLMRDLTPEPVAPLETQNSAAAESEAEAKTAPVAEKTQKGLNEENKISAVGPGKDSPLGAEETFGVSTGTRSYLDLVQRPGNRPPQYPISARKQGWEGLVVLKYFVTSAGTVEKVTMVQSSGFQSLDQEAVNAIKRYRYRPGQEGWAEHPVNFSLRAQAQNF